MAHQSCGSEWSWSSAADVNVRLSPRSMELTRMRLDRVLPVQRHRGVQHRPALLQADGRRIAPSAGEVDAHRRRDPHHLIMQDSRGARSRRQRNAARHLLGHAPTRDLAHDLGSRGKQARMVDARDERGERLESTCPRGRTRAQDGKRVGNGVVYGADAPDGQVPLPVRLEVVVKTVGYCGPILLAYRHADESGLLRKPDRHGTLARHAREDVRAAKAHARRKPATLDQSSASANRRIGAAVERKGARCLHFCADARAERMGRGRWRRFRHPGEQLAAGAHVEELAERQHVHVKRRPAECPIQTPIALPYKRVREMLVHVEARSCREPAPVLARKRKHRLAERRVEGKYARIHRDASKTIHRSGGGRLGGRRLLEKIDDRAARVRHRFVAGHHVHAVAGAFCHLREPRHPSKTGTREIDAGGIHRDQHVAGKDEQLSASRNRQTIGLAHDEVEECERTSLLRNTRQRGERLAHGRVCRRAAAVAARMAHEDAAPLEGILPFRATFKLHQHVQRGTE